MPELYLREFRFIDPLRPGADGQTADLGAGIPGRAARRMSLLGKQMYSLLKDMPTGPETTLVYATTHSEARALESYLASFPYASPTAFQTSIHPGGIEQALILEGREIGAFFPMAGGANIFEQLLRMAFAGGGGDTLLCGGEESGTWLGEFKLSWPRSFAFAMRLSGDPGNAVGTIKWDPRPSPGSPEVPDMESAVRRLDAERSLAFSAGETGSYRIDLQ